MLPLLALTAILLLTSGIVKLKAAVRAQAGLHLLSLLELVAAFLIFFLMGAAAVTGEQGFRVVVGATLLIVVSSVHLAARLRHQRRIRGLTEGRRLENYVKYLSEIPDDPGPGPGPGR